MKNLKIIFIAILFSLLLIHCSIENENVVDKNYSLVGPQPDGSFLVPTNQLLRPAGFQIYFQGRPVDLALSPNGKLLAVLNKNSLELIRVEDRTIIQRLAIKNGASYNGVAFSKDGSEIYASQSRESIHIAALNENNVLTWKDQIRFPKPKIGGHPVPGGMVLREQEDKLYVTLNRSNSLAVVTLSSRDIKEIPVGIAPYEVALYSSKKAYVSNWGGRKPKHGEPSYKSSKSEVLIDPKTGIANRTNYQTK